MVDALPFRPPNAPDIRTQLIAQMALAMAADRSNPERPYRELRVSLGAVAGDAFQPALRFANDTPDAARAVARGEIDLGILNPSCLLTMAYRGKGPFSQPLPLRAIAVMPSWDRMVFAVSERTGLTSLASIRERRYPLRVSVRASEANVTRFVADQVLDSLGFSLRQLEEWGGSLHRAETPSHPSRLQGMRDGTIEAVFDEGIGGWGPIALQSGMRFLPLEAEAHRRMEALGWSFGPITPADFPEMDREVIAVSFSGWPLVTRANLPDALAYDICKAVDSARPYVAWDSERPVDLADLCTSSDAAPLDVPLHPGAERYYIERGALPRRP